MKCIKSSLFLIFTVLIFQIEAQNLGGIHTTSKSSEKIRKEIKKGRAYLIDVRTPEEFATGHLKFAQNFDFKATDFKTKFKTLDKQKPVYLYCRSGNRSGKAKDTLQLLGFHFAYNIGGLQVLTATGLPLE
jgi:phage shock protein E